MKVLIACEFSGAVRDEFLDRGHEAWSCDLLPCESERYDDGHIEQDILDLLDETKGYWDLIIAHPPCTALCVSGNRHYAKTLNRTAAAEFVGHIWRHPCDKLCIENPVGVINRYLPYMPRPYYIHPWQFGHKEKKVTGLWTRGLPRLQPTNIVGPPPAIMSDEERRAWNRIHFMPPSEDRGKLRSITYSGIAKAMAEQWG